MGVKVLVPGVLRRLVDNRAEVELEAGTVFEAIRVLEEQSPGLRNKLTDDKGEIRRFIRLYVNDEDIDKLGGAGAALKDGDVLTIVPAAAGG